MSTSPFSTHRSKVLGYYSTAVWLRQLVLAMADGEGCPIGLTRLASLDDAHTAAALEMLAGFAKSHGNDLAFHALVGDIHQRMHEELAASERAETLDDWLRAVRRMLLSLGGRPDMTEDCTSWFEQRFDAGDAPEPTARAAIAAMIDPALPENSESNY